MKTVAAIVLLALTIMGSCNHKKTSAQDSSTKEKNDVELSEKTNTPENANYRLHDIWVLEKMNGKEITASNFTGDLPNLEINTTTNKFMGHAGCNGMNGNIAATKTTITFSNINTTKMACPNLDKEQEFLKTLEMVNTYSIAKNKLSLSQNDETMLVFKKVD